MRDGALKRARRVLLAAVAVCAALLAVSAGSAPAETGHKFLSQLTSTPLSGPTAVAVDHAGNVYVADPEVEAIDVFNSAGEFQTRFGAGVVEGEVTGIAVDLSGKVYVADLSNGVVDVFKPNGSGSYTLVSTWTGAHTFGKEFAEVAGIAIDASTNKADPRAGDIYVLDRGNAAVDVFKPAAEESQEGEFVTEMIGKPLFEEPGAIAVRPSTGQVYVSSVDLEKPIVEVFTNTGAFERKFGGSGTPTKSFESIVALGVDDTSGAVYAIDSGQHAVDQFNATGEWVGWITAAEPGGKLVQLVNPSGVAIVPGGNVYVSDPAAQTVEVYGPDVTVPDVTTDKATKLQRTSAILNGAINTKGKPSKYLFEYHEVLANETEGPRLTTPEVAATEGESKVQATIENLKAGHTYTFRLLVTSGEGVTEGARLSLETSPAVAGLSTGAAEAITATSAKLTGVLSPQKIEPTKYRFEYGETQVFGKATPYVETGAGGVVTAEAALTGLKPNTRYSYRLVAFNKFGTTFGETLNFKTTGPTITNKQVEALSHTSEKLHASIDPDKIAKSKYHIEYGETTAYGTSTAEQEIPGETEVSIEEELKGLKLATTYHYRVVLTDEQGTFFGPDGTFTTVLIDHQSVTEVGAEGAKLQAEINPLGVDTTYHFEYGETTAYGTTVPVPDEDLGSGTGDKLVERFISGLHPGTTYHFRVVASVAGIEEKGLGPDETFTAGSSATGFKLPDGRAYEMVSPPNKHSAFIPGLRKEGGVLQASVDGNALAYPIEGAIVEGPEGNRSLEPQMTLAVRSPSGWSNQEIVTPSEHAFGVRPIARSEYQQFSPDLALAIVQPFPYQLTPLAEPPLSPPKSEAERGHQEKTIYVRDNAPIAPTASEAALYNEAKAGGEQLAAEHGFAAAPGYVALVTAANTLPGASFGGKPSENGNSLTPGILFVAASPDLTHAVIRSELALTAEPSSPGALHRLYEWSGGNLSLVSLLPADEGGNVPVGSITLGGGLAGVLESTERNVRHAISENGSRVVWSLSQGRTVQGTAVGALYMRDMVKHQTIRLDLPEEGLPKAEKGEANFQGASVDGTHVFFTDPQRLTATSTSTPGQPDLYMCRIGEEAGAPTCALTDLSVDSNVGESANVQGLVLGTADNGSAVYYVATGALAPGAESGKFNLYLAQQAGSWHPRFVATLSSEDRPDWATVKPAGEEAAQPRLQTARVSPSGNWLAFMSNRRLTGYDNTDVNELVGLNETAHQHADEEVFLYEAAGNNLVCPSCNPSGARPRGVFDVKESGEGEGLLVDRPEQWSAGAVGIKTFPVDHWLAGSLPAWTRVSQEETLYQSNYLNDEGRLFFTSADALTPAATGHTRTEVIGETPAQVGVENVYQWERNGLGSCALAAGCVSLLSGGGSNRESAFLDASVSGNDVFFLTGAKLLPQDGDTSYDIYDARVCTESSPCVPEGSVPSPACEKVETCRPGSFLPPPGETPASSNFSGPGNTTHVVEEEKGGVLPHQESKTSNAQKLAAALKKCHKLAHKTKAQKRKRAKCEAQARKKYPVKKASKSGKTSSSHARGGSR